MTNKLILIVNDDLNLSQSIALILHRAGYLVSTIDCAYKALEKIQSGLYRLVILDTHMPETNLVLLPNILKAFPELSLIILTEPPLSETEEQYRLMCVNYVIKPISPERLLNWVRSAMNDKPSLVGQAYW